jgi:hypothetical protein
MNLSTLAILIGVGISIPQIYGLMNPAGFTRGVRKFPRSLLPGYILMAIGAAWFLSNLNRETISDFANYKKVMLLGFASLAFLTCIFVRDFLAVRGLAIVLLMLASFTLNTTRWADTPWRLVLVVLAYFWVLAGMWFTVSPWRLRDILDWMTADEKRVRVGSAVRLLLGLFIIALGLTAFR